MHRTSANGWLSGLDHSDYCWRGWVRSPESVAEWITDLGHRDDLVRAHAARSLGQAGGVAKPAVPRLRELLADPTSAVRFAAAHALQQITADHGRGTRVDPDRLKVRAPGIAQRLARLVLNLWP
jgi:hypothetical protein